MRVIFLNVLDGELKGRLKNFLNNESPKTDIFCFQEVYRSASFFEKALPDFRCLFVSKKVNDRDYFAQTIFVRKNLEVNSWGEVLKENSNLGLSMYAVIENGSKDPLICNVHGLAQPGHKLDTPERLLQSNLLVKYLRKTKGPKIIGGDFNILPEAESIKVFEKNGYRNLIKDYKISTTRNEYAWAKYPGNILYFSDYVFVSTDIGVKNFEVPSVEVSDHLPLILDFEI